MCDFQGVQYLLDVCITGGDGYSVKDTRVQLDLCFTHAQKFAFRGFEITTELITEWQWSCNCDVCDSLKKTYISNTKYTENKELLEKIYQHLKEEGKLL